MKKSTKGAIAAGAAAVLLMGGAGTLAFWTATDNVDAGSLTAGNLSLDLDSCDGWVYSADSSAVTKIVPGDVVENTCNGTITGEGDNLVATVAIDDATVPDLTLGTEQLDVTAELTSPVEATPGAGVPVTAAGTDVTFTITVDFPYGTENNGSQDGVAALGNIAVDAVQVDPNP